MECVRWRARIPSPGCDRAARGLPHGVLYGATLLHDVPRRVPRRRGRAASYPRVAGRDDAAACGARRPRLRGRLPRRPRPARRRGAPGARAARFHAARDGARRGRPRPGLGALRHVAGAPVAGRMAPGRVLPAGARQVPRRRAVRRDRGAAGVRARRRERHAHRSTAHRRRGQRRCPRRLGDQRSLAALPDRQRAALRALLPRRRAGTPRLLGDALMQLTLVVFSPIAGAALLALLPREEVRGIRRAALAFALVTLVLSLGMLRRFAVGTAEFQMVERAAWIPQWGIEYRLGVDGVSLFLVLLTTVLTPIVVLASWGDIHRRGKAFFAFPLHTWLPDAHVEAPTGGSVILAGVLLKMGTYGFLRFALPLFPRAVETAAPLMVGLAVAGIVYGALVATVQPDLKKLVAYSSVSHLGFVMLGLFALHPTAVAGSVYQMLNHGLSTGGLFLLVGMIYERRHPRLLADFGGLWTAVPVYAAFFLVVMLASVGLPGLNGFVGEFLILLGSFGRWPWATAVATSGVILGALYLLWMYERVIFGPLAHEENAKLEDLSAREVTVLLPVVALCLVMGLFPAPFLTRMQPSIDLILQRLAPPPQVATR